jgi:hypothetical protein
MNFNGVFSAQTFRQDVEIVHFMWSCRDRHCGGRSRRVAGQAEAPAEEHLTPNSGGSEPMYLPELFRVEDVPQMHALMRARPFAALVSAGSSGLFASHLRQSSRTRDATASSNAISRAPIRTAGTLPTAARR